MMEKNIDAVATYQIKISGVLDRRWVTWFDKMQITTETGTDGKPVTVLTGPVVDQVALRGLLTRIWDLNIVLISLQRFEDNVFDIGGNPNEIDG